MRIKKSLVKPKKNLQNYKIYTFSTLAGTKLSPLSFSFSPNFVHTFLTVASGECEFSSNSTKEIFPTIVVFHQLTVHILDHNIVCQKQCDAKIINSC